jgi:hypothetical protein
VTVNIVRALDRPEFAEAKAVVLLALGGPTIDG